MIAARLEQVPHAGSTNADLRVAAEREPERWPHLSVLLTDDQRSGRGRLDRRWVAPAGASLAISVLVDAERIPPGARGWIPLVAGVAMAESVAAQLPDSARSAGAVTVKWPNDVLVAGAEGTARKIAGILAEALSEGRVIIGVGVNTAMTEADRPVPTATSLAIEGGTPDVDALVALFLARLDELLRALGETGDAVRGGVHAAATACCGTLGQTVAVSLPGGGTLTGEATGLAADGRLIVRTSHGEQLIAAGDIVHLRPAPSAAG